MSEYPNEFLQKVEDTSRDLDNQLRKMNLIKNMCNISCCSLVLDMGCGTGLELLAFHEPGFELIGIDLSYALVKKCHEITRR